MAVRRKPRGRWWSPLHFLVRFAGLTGLLVGGVGLVMALLADQLTSWEAAWASARAALTSEPGTQLPQLAMYLLLGGGLAALVALLVEAAVVLLLVAGRRSASGFNAAVQAALAIALLVGVNAYSFRHYLRFDWTKNELFTLPADVQEQLGQLKGETQVVVYKRHKTFGTLSNKPPDRYDTAAERKVEEKVKDLVEQFREFGARLRVTVLDVEDEDYEDKLTNLTRGADELREAITSAPENSIFFYRRDEDGRIKSQMQRLSFNAFYQLDKTASREDNNGRGNLVLRHQGRGVDAFARRVFNIDMKRPRVGVLTVDDWMATKGEHSILTHKGLAKSLNMHGFEVVDVILKRDAFDPRLAQPAAYTFDEVRYTLLEEQLQVLKETLEENEAARKLNAERRKRVNPDDVSGTDNDALAEVLLDERERSLPPGLVLARPKEELRRIREYLDNVGATEKKVRVAGAAKYLERRRDELDRERSALEQEQAKLIKEQEALTVESAAEIQKLKDVQAKLERLLADCDLVILPRFTVYMLARGWYLSFQHDLYPAHAAALKKFLAGGKPLLACFGPNPEPSFAKPEVVEEMLGELGIKLGRHTVLYRAEVRALAAAQPTFGASLADVKVPALEFDWPAGASQPLLAEGEPRPAPRANPIREGLRIASRSVGESLDLRLRFGRPVYYVPAGPGPAHLIAQSFAAQAQAPAGAPAGILAQHLAALGMMESEAFPLAVRDQLPFEPEIVQSGRDAWNEDQPLLRPRPPKENAARGNLEQKGNGPFPLGVAIETVVPVSWYEAKDAKPAKVRVAVLAAGAVALAVLDDDAKPAKVRVAVLGHGNLFTGDELSPAKEKLLIDTCNWLVGRDDLLAREDPAGKDGGVWKYPRLTNFSDRQQQLWHWGTQLGMPALFAYLGLVVVMVRRLR